MTLQERYIANVRDILSIRLLCTKCKASLNVPFGKREYIPETCPYCKENWFRSGSTEHNHLMWLLMAMSAFRDLKESQPCEVSLELPRPE
jgi:hypothetical protein